MGANLPPAELAPAYAEGRVISLPSSPLTPALSPWERESPLCQLLERPLSHGERDRVRGNALWMGLILQRKFA